MATSYSRETDVMADLANAAMADPGLERLVLSGARTPGGLRKVEIRPVLVRGRTVLNVARYDDHKSLTANAESAADPLVQALLSDFRHLTAQTATDRTEARITKRGKTLVTVTPEGRQPDLQHDRAKHTLVAEDAPFLDVVGLSSNKTIKPTQQRKWRQVNEFLRLLSSVPSFDAMLATGETVRIADMGSGNAYLTFATYHYVTVVRGSRCEIVGIDRDAGAVARADERARALGPLWAGLTFRQGDIGDADLPWRPQVVVALHACDTATDDAAARAITDSAEIILLAPCCHHHLQRQLKARPHEGSAAALLRPGILRERFGDVLTDALRTALIASQGYRTDVVQFVAPEHTAKNVMIRAWRDPTVDRAAQRRDYDRLRDEWQVEPYLEMKLSIPAGAVRVEGESRHDAGADTQEERP